MLKEEQQMTTVQFLDEHPAPGHPDTVLMVGIAHDDSGVIERGGRREVVRVATQEDVDTYPDAYQAYVDAGGSLTPPAPEQSPDEAPAAASTAPSPAPPPQVAVTVSGPAGSLSGTPAPSGSAAALPPPPPTTSAPAGSPASGSGTAASG